MNPLAVPKLNGRKKIFYAGLLRPFKHVGHHPQFDHIRNPPDGYEFVTGQRLSIGMSFLVLRAITDLFLKARKNGARPIDAITFIRSRSLRAQCSVPNDLSLAFLPSFPYTVGQVPWIVEIEDTTTLFSPFARIDGKRLDPRLLGPEGVYDSGFYPNVKALLESDDCRGVVCHVRSTADSIPVLFNNPKLSKKVFYIPFGIEPPIAGRQPRQDDKVTILFTSSWNQGVTGFYLRGGLDVMEAYVRLREKYRNLRLLLRCRLPVEIRERYRALIEEGDIQVFDEFLSVEEMEELFCKADIYALPSARLHVVSILQAMAHGLALVVSDGWGINEYVEDGKTAMVVSGRYGTCSWMDSSGMLRENYKPLFSVNPQVVHQLVDKLDQLIQSSSLCQELGEAARREVDENFSVRNWNSGLAKAFDRALS